MKSFGAFLTETNMRYDEWAERVKKLKPGEKIPKRKVRLYTSYNKLVNSPRNPKSWLEYQESTVGKGQYLNDIEIKKRSAITYSGEVSKGLPNGEGFLYLKAVPHATSQVGSFRVNGTFKNGMLLRGKANIVFTGRGVFVGEVKGFSELGFEYGKGTFTQKNFKTGNVSYKQEGEFRDLDCFSRETFVRKGTKTKYDENKKLLVPEIRWQGKWEWHTKPPPNNPRHDESWCFTGTKIYYENKKIEKWKLGEVVSTEFLKNKIQKNSSLSAEDALLKREAEKLFKGREED